jgi:hypothetical protein
MDKKVTMPDVNTPTRAEHDTDISILTPKLLKAMLRRKGDHKYVRQCKVWLQAKGEEIKVPKLKDVDLNGWLIVVDYHY